MTGNQSDEVVRGYFQTLSLPSAQRIGPPRHATPRHATATATATATTTTTTRYFSIKDYCHSVMSSFLSPYPHHRQQPPPSKPPSQSSDSEEEFRQQTQSRRPSVPHERFRGSDLPAVPSSKPHLSHLPWIGDLIVDDRTPLPSLSKVSKTEWTLVRAQGTLDVATSDEDARDSPLAIPVKSQAPLEVVPCEAVALASPLGIPFKSQAPLGMITRGMGVLTLPRGTSTKSKHTTSNKTPSTSWVVMFLFLINVLPSLIFAQISTTEYVTFVAGTDTVDAALSNTPPNVFPGARAYHAGFYERSQKCYYTFGGVNSRGN